MSWFSEGLDDETTDKAIASGIGGILGHGLGASGKFGAMGRFGGPLGALGALMLYNMWSKRGGQQPSIGKAVGRLVGGQKGNPTISPATEGESGEFINQSGDKIGYELQDPSVVDALRQRTLGEMGKGSDPEGVSVAPESQIMEILEGLDKGFMSPERTPEGLPKWDPEGLHFRERQGVDITPRQGLERKGIANDIDELQRRKEQERIKQWYNKSEMSGY